MKNRNIMFIDDLKVYSIAMEVAEKVYKDIMKWNDFSKDTIGKQLIRSADSIAANISEGHGRFHYKSNKLFNYYSRGSLNETYTWLTKAKNRKLINEERFLEYKNELTSLSVKLNNYIKSIGKK
ncbi:MAG: four helix bundle protein [Bacteroidales bacterium]|nr:four helix bundle protein [Bacteroidales bacterium]